MILDATAANRTMWRTKDSEHIIYIDMEKKLTIKPTIFCCNHMTPFLAKSFHDIFYDPPHFHGDKSSFYVMPDAESFQKKWQGYGDVPRYYGGDKYNSKSELLSHIFKAQREFLRILRDDGMLWLKWNESMIKLGAILHLFDSWSVMLKIPCKLSNPNRTDKRTYWVCLMKKKMDYEQKTLI